MRSREIEEYKQGLKLQKPQREVLVGLLLGDAHLETKDNGKTYRLKIEQSEKHAAYVQHLYRLFEEWVRTPPQPKSVSRGEHSSINWWFQTLSHGAFRFFAAQFYENKRKKVPLLIHRWLTPKALAYWFMDDGSTKSTQSKAVIFNTHCYSSKEIELLCQVLTQKYELVCKAREQRDGTQIYISGSSFERFREIVQPYIISEMNYKIPATRRT